MTVTVVSLRNGVFSSTLLFHPLKAGHDRLYTCSMTLDIPNYSTSSNTSQYMVVNGKLLSFYLCKYATQQLLSAIDAAYFQLKFTLGSCINTPEVTHFMINV